MIAHGLQSRMKESYPSMQRASAGPELAHRVPLPVIFWRLEQQASKISCLDGNGQAAAGKWPKVSTKWRQRYWLGMIYSALSEHAVS